MSFTALPGIEFRLVFDMLLFELQSTNILCTVHFFCAALGDL